MTACVVCGEEIPPSGKLGRPRTSHPECKARLLSARRRAYYAANRDKEAAYQRAYYERFAAELPSRLAEQVDHDRVEVERAVDAVMAGERVRLAVPERLVASLDVLRLGGRSPALRRLGWSGYAAQALLAWWESR